MITTRSFIDQIWVDLNSPTKEEVDSLILTHNISPTVAKDMLTPTPTQHAEEFGENIYTVIHIPSLHSTENNQEVDLLIADKSLITSRYDSIDALHYFSKRIEVDDILNKKEDSHIFFEMMKDIYQSIINELAFMDDQMKRIEKNIFENKEKDMVLAISNASRILLNFKRTLDPHGKIFEFLRDTGNEKFGGQFKKNANDILEEWRQVMRMVNNQIDLATELRETNNSMLSTKQNEVMKTLTILAFVTFPLSMVASIFGMNAINMPIIGTAYDFWKILGLMITISLAMFAYFKYKKWI